jgi:TrmH family RNA methyltransferase
MEKITGKNNDIIKNVKKLLSSTSKRREQGLFVLEGARLVFDVLNSFYKIKYFLITEDAYEKYQSKADLMVSACDSAYIISNEISEKLSDTKSSQGVFAVCYISDNNAFSYDNNSKLIALDNVQDPGNLGTIVRTAEALGINGVIVGGGCDIYNPKVLRASMGSMLRINIMQTDNLVSTLEQIKSNGLALCATSPDSNSVPITECDFSSGAVCVIGNEANGVSDEVMELCDCKITIKMLGRAESLNASVAAAITMWEMLR